METEIRYFAKFDADGYPLGFFPSDIWPKPPVGTIEISKDEWQAMIDAPGTLGMKDGELVELPPRPIEMTGDGYV